MSSDAASSFYSKHRIEALSDGIFAIVMTLLVLELKVPVDVPHGHLWEALRQDPESWIAFAVTFSIAARYWMLQHRVFDLAQDFRQQTLVLTFLFLGLVAVLPFSTALIGRHGSEPVAVLIYCINQAAIGAVLICKLEYVRRTGRLPRTPALRQLRIELWFPAVTMALGALCSAFLPVKYIFVLLSVLGLIKLRFLRATHAHPTATAT